jgi:methylenetetrahydrofolate reductase (NADPH)
LTHRFGRTTLSPVRIVDRLKQGTPAFSFEFFPPKTEEGEVALFEVLAELKALRPAFVSVTYGAGGSTRRRTIELTARIKRELGIEAMAHVTCVGSTRDEMAAVLDQLGEAGIENVLALRGDPPGGEGTFRAPVGGFRYGAELVEFIRSRYAFCCGAACYPEGHVEAASPEQDLVHLKEKVDAGAEFLISQLFFDNQLFFAFWDRVRAIGIEVPIVPGLMPVLNVDQLKRFTKMCGASIPEPFLTQLEDRREYPTRVRELGVLHASLQASELLGQGAPGLHFYTLNKSTATREIFSALRSQHSQTY